jgi:serine/threonine-protein kinase
VSTDVVALKMVYVRGVSLVAPDRIGPYEIITRLATGGMAEVFLGRRTGPHGFEKYVAVKRILPELASDRDFLGMFIDEARIGAKLHHPNVVQVFDFGEIDGAPYIVLELVQGSTAGQLLRAAPPAPRERGDLRDLSEDFPVSSRVSVEAAATPIPTNSLGPRSVSDAVTVAPPTVSVATALHVALSVLRALAYAHDLRDERGRPLNLVHRDVSPSNVLFDTSGGVKLTDFGIVRFTDMDRRTVTGQVKGKAGYMSPEQVRGEELDARSDLFNIGILLAELLLGEPLFRAHGEVEMLLRIRDANIDVIERSPRVPEALRPVLRRALARHREDRYPSAADFARALGEYALLDKVVVAPDALLSTLQSYGLVMAPTPPPAIIKVGAVAVSIADDIHERLTVRPP